MPIPAELVAAISRASPAFDPAATRTLYDDNKSLWELYRDMTELDRSKLKDLLEKHGDSEDEAKYGLRKKLVTVFNLIPSMLNVIKGYLFSEEPSIDVNGDSVLEQFMSDCDGAGTSYVDFVRKTVLPLSMVYGWIDVLVENPFSAEQFQTQQQAIAAGVVPTARVVTPLQRINWSAAPNHAYNWVRFKDVANETDDPFHYADPPDSFITYSAKGPGPNGAGFWLRSWRQSSTDGKKLEWQHDGNWLPIPRVPIATLYYQQSHDPDRRHFGISKIAMMAILTHKIIQILSWTDEDVLSNLAIMCLPTRDGKLPKAEDGSPLITSLGAFSVISFPKDATQVPFVLQGGVDHIAFKLKLIDTIIREILRIAHLIGASAEDEKITSGRQGLVMRTELFQELGEQAGALDSLTLDILALVKSWETGEDWDRQRLADEVKPVVSFNKKFPAMEPLDTLIDQLEKLTRLMSATSPKLIERLQVQVAMAALYADDRNRETVIDEIEANSAAQIEENQKVRDLTAGVADAGDNGELAIEPEDVEA